MRLGKNTSNLCCILDGRAEKRIDLRNIHLYGSWFREKSNKKNIHELLLNIFPCAVSYNVINGKYSTITGISISLVFNDNYNIF